jgi:hypothetical protein
MKAAVARPPRMEMRQPVMAVFGQFRKSATRAPATIQLRSYLLP